MFREKIELINMINDKKKDITDHINVWSMEQVNAAKSELETLQAKLDLMLDIEGQQTPDVPKNAKPATKDSMHEFADAARHGFRNMNNETTPADGGYTVPQDIQTKINEFREAKFSLASLVTTENVTAPTGRRTYQVRAQHTGFTSVAEAAKIGAKAGPQFTPVNYTITKYAGYLPVTNELLADSDANINAVLINWLGEEDVATRNALILAEIAKATAVDLEDLDGIKKALNVTLGQAFAPTSAVITNDDGLNYLDTLKDDNKRYLLQPDINPANPFDMVLAIGARRVPVIVVPNAILPTSDEDAVPFIIGDLKEYVRIFDRQQLTIAVSDIAAVGTGANAINAFEEDLTIFRAITRLDAEIIDSTAIVNGYITVEGAGPEGATGATGETGNL